MSNASELYRAELSATQRNQERNQAEAEQRPGLVIYNLGPAELEPYLLPAALEAEAEARALFLEAGPVFLEALEACREAQRAYQVTRAEYTAARCRARKVQRNQARKARKAQRGPAWLLARITAAAWLGAMVAGGLVIGRPLLGLLFPTAYILAGLCGLFGLGTILRAELEARAEQR